MDAFFDIGPPEAGKSTHIKSGILALKHKSTFPYGYLQPSTRLEICFFLPTEYASVQWLSFQVEMEKC